MTDPTIPELVAQLREKVQLARRVETQAVAVDCGELSTLLDALKRGTDALARAWEEGAEAAFEAQDSGPDSEYIRPLFGRALDEFYASNPYRGREKTPQRR